ncbi:MAG TPA: 3-isopropylmalate dehydratase small subunit, partial [Pseudonocardiaceae bacterium]|nr:3-isopropylmalate dehydratase small subunit [Pseudonocardiaceae bacterium]
VISPRFGDIFRGNAGKQGLLAAQCERADVESLWTLLETEPGTEVTVDLSEQTVQARDLTVSFAIDSYTRWRLLEGLDDIELSLRHARQIDAFEAARPSWLPTTVAGSQPGSQLSASS